LVHKIQKEKENNKLTINLVIIREEKRAYASNIVLMLLQPEIEEHTSLTQAILQFIHSSMQRRPLD
jgi:hypothetical protein